MGVAEYLSIDLWGLIHLQSIVIWLIWVHLVYEDYVQNPAQVILIHGIPALCLNFLDKSHEPTCRVGSNFNAGSRVNLSNIAPDTRMASKGEETDLGYACVWAIWNSIEYSDTLYDISLRILAAYFADETS